MWALIDIGRGYHLGAPNMKTDLSPTFPSSILHIPLFALPGLNLCHIPKAKTIIHIGPPSIEMALS
jgi:hypothetical protein